MRRLPDRLVSRFGSLIDGPQDSHRPDDFVTVHWDDGEINLVELVTLLPMNRMNDNPRRLPVVAYVDEMGGNRSRREREVSLTQEFRNESRLQRLALTCSL
jgi:hypothetical protein